MKCVQNRQELKKLKAGRQIVRSCNSNKCLKKRTKLLIVGTLTPPDGRGYFYTAPRNRIYGYIDEALGTEVNGLKCLKEQLKENDKPNNKPIIDKIKKYLTAHKIAFLDVIQCALRKHGKQNSPADSDIEYYCLDYTRFEQLQNRTDIKVICNSELAKSCYDDIKISISDLPEADTLSQRSAEKKEWIKAIKDAVG